MFKKKRNIVRDSNITQIFLRIFIFIFILTILILVSPVQILFRLYDSRQKVQLRDL